jgi:hypothetical protein
MTEDYAGFFLGFHPAKIASSPRRTRLESDPVTALWISERITRRLGAKLELGELFRSWEEDLVNEAVTELHHARLKHYLADGEDVTRERVGRFIECALECFNSRRAEPMVEHAGNIARERFKAGYDLFEVQTAINVIEEALWKRILSSVEPDELAHALGMVNAIFGMSKDVLARTYVSLTTKRKTPRFELDDLLDGIVRD